MIKRGPISIVLFAEDPGAVNSLAPLAIELRRRGEHVVLLSAGHATVLLQARGLDPRPVAHSGEAVRLLLESGAPRLLVGTSENPDSPGLALISAARDAGRQSIGLIDFAANAAFRFRGTTANPLAFAPDWLLVPDTWTAREYEAIGFPATRIKVSGHPHYDHVMQRRVHLEEEGRTRVRHRLLPEIPMGKAVVAFVSEISTGLDPQQYRWSTEYTLRGRGDAEGRTAIVVEELLDAVAELFAEDVSRPCLILRRHPKEPETELAGYLHEFDVVSRGGDPLELAYVCDLIVGMSSMLLLEANLLGVPTLSLLPRVRERNWLPTIREGITPCATSRVELQQHLREILGAPKGSGARSSSPKQNRAAIQLGATVAIADFLSNSGKLKARSEGTPVSFG